MAPWAKWLVLYILARQWAVGCGPRHGHTKEPPDALPPFYARLLAGTAAHVPRAQLRSRMGFPPSLSRVWCELTESVGLILKAIRMSGFRS